MARKFGGRQEERAGARPWHEAEQRPAAPGAREHHVRDAPVHPREEHREHGTTLSRAARRRQPCNGSVAVLDFHWHLALPLLISRDGPGSLPLSPNSKRERGLGWTSPFHALGHSGPRPPGKVSTDPPRLDVAYAHARSDRSRRQPRSRRAGGLGASGAEQMLPFSGGRPSRTMRTIPFALEAARSR